MIHRNNILAALAVVLSVATAVSQGLYVESQGSGNDGTEKFWYMPKMFRSAEGEGKIMILRLDKEVMYSLDPSKKTYTEMKFADIQNMASAGKARMEAMMKQRMAALPPEQRKAMEERLATMQGNARGADTRYEVVSTGESKTVAGYQCTKYVIKRNGKKSEIVWATNDIKDFGPIRTDMENLMNKMSTLTGTHRPGSEWYKEIKGFPMETESNGSVRTVTQIERQTIAPSQFEVPAGYTKENVKGLEKMNEGTEEK